MRNSSGFAGRANVTFGVMGGKSGKIAARSGNDVARSGKVGGKNGKARRQPNPQPLPYEGRGSRAKGGGERFGSLHPATPRGAIRSGRGCWTRYAVGKVLAAWGGAALMEQIYRKRGAMASGAG